jgi:peptidoglycan/LPS O-acetylase OafA/YrhL
MILTERKSNASVNSYRSDIDGLRSLAILSVLLYHSGVSLFSGGFTGVDIFFVISGYLIGGHIFSELRGGRFSFMSFYQRRAKRILPAFYVVLAFTILVSLFLLSPYEAAEFGRSAFWSTLSASNILFWQTTGYFDQWSELHPLLMTWSLGVEEQFYAVIPLLLVLLSHVRRSWMLPAILISCVISFVFSVRELGTHPVMVFYMLPARAWELGIGVALAVAEREKRFAVPAAVAQIVSIAGLALVVAPMLLLTVAIPFPGAAALPSVLGTAMLLATPDSWIGKRLLSLPPLVFIGRISYSLYLWHWPLLAFGRVVYGGPLPAATTAIAIALAFAAAILSYYLVEQPFRKSKQAPAPLLLRYAAVSVAVLAACAVLWFSHGVPQRNPELAKLEASGFSLVNDPCLDAYGNAKPNMSPRCYESTGDKPAVALWGDSHSAALAPGIRAAAIAGGYSFDQFGKASCPPLNGATRFLAGHPMLASECLQFNRKVLDLLDSDKRIRVVILAGFWTAPFHQTLQDGWLTADLAHEREVPSLDASSTLFEQALTASIRALQAAGKEVIVLDDVPIFDVSPVWRVRTTRIAARRNLASWLRLRESNDPGYASPIDAAGSAQTAALLQQTLANLPGVQLVDLKPVLCSGPSQCAYRDNDKLLYADPQHLSADGALYALRNFRLPELPLPARQTSTDAGPVSIGSNRAAPQK